MKKFLSFLLTFVMLFSLAMPAMAAEGTQTIYFENTANWTTVNAYAWDAENNIYLGNWPGTAMTNVEGNIWSIEVSTDAVNMIFNDGSNQTADLTIPTDGKNLYNSGSGSWSTYGSTGDTSGPTVNGGTSGNVTATYTPTAKITGVSITVDGTLYTEGNVTIKPDSTVTLTVTGTNLQNGTWDNLVAYADGYSYPVMSDYFTFSDDGTTATTTLSTRSFSYSSNYEIVYYNNYTADERIKNPTGIYVTYDSGIAEEDKAVIAGVSITVDGTLYTEGNVTIKPDSTVTLTVTGTNLQNGTMDNHVNYAALLGFTLTPDYFTFSDDGTTATSDISAGGFCYSSNFEIVYYNNYTADRTENYTGIYVTYDDGTTPTYTVDIVSNITNGTVTANMTTAAEGETVTVTFTPDAGYVLFQQDAFDPDDSTKNVELTQGTDANTYTFTMPAHDVMVQGVFAKDGKARNDLYFDNGGNTAWTDVTAYFYTDTNHFVDAVPLTMAENGVYTLPEGEVIPNLAYKVFFYSNNDDSTVTLDIPTDDNNMFTLGTTTNVYGQYEGTWSVYTPSQPPVGTTSAEISWGSMSFTYTDEAGAWSADTSEGAGTVTVKNTGTTSVTASAVYNPETNYAEITGSLGDAKTLAAAESGTFTLTLSGKPAKAIPAGTKIGSVTVIIEEAAAAPIPVITGVQLSGDAVTLEGNTYTIIAPADSASFTKVYITLFGTNLTEMVGNNSQFIAGLRNGQQTNLSKSFVINEDDYTEVEGGIYTKKPLYVDSTQIGTYDLAFSNDNQNTWTDTGYDIVVIPAAG